MKKLMIRALALGLVLSVPHFAFAEDEKPADGEKKAKKGKKAKAAPAEGGEKAPADKGGDKAGDKK
jgi:hypothetical protein